jgi:hypothetical protein
MSGGHNYTSCTPFGGPASRDLLVDKLIGQAYEIVKSVAASLTVIRHVSDNLPALHDLYVRTKDLESVIEALEALLADDQRVEDILTIVPYLDDLRTVVENIAAIQSAYENIDDITNAPDYAAAARESLDFAAKWASAAEDTDIDDGVNPVGKSAYHWAQIAEAAAAALANGLNWVGDYDAGTEYSLPDSVLYQGSSWRYTNETPSTGNTPPTLPTTSNTYWELIARRGTDGTGTVVSIVAGDGIAVDNTDPANPVLSSYGVAGPDKADEATAIGGADDEDYMTSLGVRRAITTLLMPLFNLASAISIWNADTGTRSLYGGMALGAGSSALGGGGTGRTFVLDSKKHRIRQDGLIRSVKMSLLATYTGDKTNSLKVSVLRESGSGYTLVSQSGLLSPTNTTSTQTLNLATPIACQKGDVVAIWVKGFSPELNIRGAALTGAKVRYQDGEALPGTWTDVNDFGMDVVFEGQSPFIISTGDSILAGFNTATPWYTHYDALGISGTPASDPMDAVEDAVSGLSYQNFCQGNTTWADAVAKVAAINSVGSKAVVAAYGVNDIATGRSWVDVEADMNAFKAGLSAGKKLFVCEILPWTAGDDAKAATTRLFNANYAAWCAANDATLIRTHDAMGQVRVSTGELDDLKTSYNYDGVHLTSPGIAALADHIRDALGSILWID